MLASKSASLDQKLMVLELLKKICGTPQKLLDIFINYDCDPEALDSNIFEKITSDMCKIVQSKGEIDPQSGVLVDDVKLKTKVVSLITLQSWIPINLYSISRVWSAFRKYFLRWSNGARRRMSPNLVR